MKRHILLTFVGTNDAGELRGKSDGAVLSAAMAIRYDEIHLLWNDGISSELTYERIAEYLKKKIHQIIPTSQVHIHKIEITDVTDHNEIYPALLSICKSIYHEGSKYTAAIASGTPAMQVCWILMAESGDFPIDLIRSNEPRFGKPLVTPIKLGTGLPRILRLEEENKDLEQRNLRLIPQLKLDIKNGLVFIGDITIHLSPVEFCYYRYFVERKLQTDDFARISGIFVPQEFVDKTLQYKNESFPEKCLSEKESKMVRSKGIMASTYRSNVSKANMKIHQAVRNDGIAHLIEIGIEGKKNSKLYGLRVPKCKIFIMRAK